MILQIQYTLDCRVFKYPRPESKEPCKEIPKSIIISELTDEQVFEVDGSKVKVIHTPGHTTDHIILTTPDGILFSGDCILGDESLSF